MLCFVMFMFCYGYVLLCLCFGMFMLMLCKLTVRHHVFVVLRIRYVMFMFRDGYVLLYWENVYVCLGVLVYVYVFVRVCMFICVFVCVCWFVYVCLSVCLSVCLLNGIGDPGSQCPYRTLKTFSAGDLERNKE